MQEQEPGLSEGAERGLNLLDGAGLTGPDTMQVALEIIDEQRALGVGAGRQDAPPIPVEDAPLQRRIARRAVQRPGVEQELDTLAEYGRRFVERASRRWRAQRAGTDRAAEDARRLRQADRAVTECVIDALHQRDRLP